MNQQTHEGNEQIKNIAGKFVADTLGSESPAGMCFAICFPLHIHLTNNGFANSIRAGNVPKLGTLDFTPHYWLNLEDEEDTILDPTIQQFKSDLPPSFTEEKIYIGEKPENYNEFPKCDFYGVYKIWKESFAKEFELRATSNVNFKAAQILKAETEQLSSKKDFAQSDIVKKYFDYITMQEVAEDIKDCLLELADLYNAGKPICDFDDRYVKLVYSTDRSKDMLACIKLSEAFKKRIYIRSVVLTIAYANDHSLDLEFVYKP